MTYLVTAPGHFRRVARASTAIRTAEHYALDKGAAVVWVYRDGVAVATMNAALHWTKHAGDEALFAAVGDR